MGLNITTYQSSGSNAQKMALSLGVIHLLS